MGPELNTEPLCVFAKDVTPASFKPYQDRMGRLALKPRILLALRLGLNHLMKLFSCFDLLVLASWSAIGLCPVVLLFGGLWMLP